MSNTLNFKSGDLIRVKPQFYPESQRSPSPLVRINPAHGTTVAKKIEMQNDWPRNAILVTSIKNVKTSLGWSTVVWSVEYLFGREQGEFLIDEQDAPAAVEVLSRGAGSQNYE